MKMWLDTEFNDYKGELISLALVAEDGSEWYGVRFCDDPSPWVKKHVMPQLNQAPENDDVLRASLDVFLRKNEPVHIVADWPADIAHFCIFLEHSPGMRIGPNCMTLEVWRDDEYGAPASRIPHNALADARALAEFARGLQ